MLHFHLGAPLYDERAQGLVGGGILLRSRVHQEVVRALSTNDESLLSVQDPVIAFTPRYCCRPEEIGASPRLGQRFRDCQPPLDRRPQPALLLLRRAEDVQRLTDDAHQTVKARKARAQHPDLFQRHDLIRPAETPAAVLWVKAQAQELSAGGRLHELARVRDLSRIHVQEQLARDVVSDKCTYFVP